MFVLIFVVFSVLLLGIISWQSSVQIQRQQANEIERDARQLRRLDQLQGFRAVIFAVDRLSRQPGPGIYYLGDPAGIMIAGNVSELPVNVLQEPGIYSFDYERPTAFLDESGSRREGNAVVRSLVLDSGLILVVGRDVVERRGFTAIIFQSFLWGVGGILVFSLIAGGVTAVRVLRRIEGIASTSRMIMSGNLSERVPVTRRNDEFDGLAQNLNQMLDRIEQLMQGLKEVTDNVAHDLKTPLSRLRNKAEAALRDGANETARRDALEATIAESDKLIRTFNALLMIARAESGGASTHMAEFDAADLVRGVAELYDPLADEKGLTLKIEAAPPAPVRCNRELVTQALANLVDNAIKYAAPRRSEAGGGAEIVVRARSDGDRVLLTVADNGPGIVDADRSRVVERFVRLEQSRSEPGSGLGLSLASAVARLHGGELNLEDNRPGLRAVLVLPRNGPQLPTPGE